MSRVLPAITTPSRVRVTNSRGRPRRDGSNNRRTSAVFNVRPGECRTYVRTGGATVAARALLMLTGGRPPALSPANYIAEVLVSIVVLNYNYAHFLHASIGSALGQVSAD